MKKDDPVFEHLCSRIHPQSSIGPHSIEEFHVLLLNSSITTDSQQKEYLEDSFNDSEEFFGKPFKVIMMNDPANIKSISSPGKPTTRRFPSSSLKAIDKNYDSVSVSELLTDGDIQERF